MPIRRSFQRLARLLKPRRPVRRADRLRQRPFLEYLESRTVPTTLFVRGDQPGPGFPDVIDLDVTDSGGVRVTLNGQVSEFAPGQFTDVSVQSGGGNDLVHVLRTVVPVSINSTGNARVIAGVNGTVGGIQAGVTITNSISRSTVEVDDSADAAFQTLTISTVSVAGGAGRRVAFAGVAPIDSQDSSTRTLTVDTGTAGAQVNMQNSSTKPVSLVVHADNTNLSITSGLITLNGPQTIHDLTLTGGELRGSGDLTVSGTLTWNGGTLRGPGRTIAQATMLLGGGDKFLVGRGLVNTATATWTAGTVFASRAAALANQAGALFDLQSDGALSSVFDTTSVFTNTGTLRKSAGSGITTLGIPFNNAGAVEVNSGTLNVGNGTSSGSFTVAQGNTLQFFVGTHLLGAASVVTGDGTVRFGSGAIVTVAGTYNVANTVIDLGTVSFDADNSITNLTLGFGGTLTGSATLTVVGPITWTGGTMTGTGRTVAQSGLAIVGPNDKVWTTSARRTGPAGASLSEAPR